MREGLVQTELQCAGPMSGIVPRLDPSDQFSLIGFADTIDPCAQLLPDVLDTSPVIAPMKGVIPSVALARRGDIESAGSETGKQMFGRPVSLPTESLELSPYFSSRPFSRRTRCMVAPMRAGLLLITAPASPRDLILA